MKERLFKFKQFEVAHYDSPMKVGVDAVLLGAWADTSNVKSCLDVGTGCGVIALCVAQRTTDTIITGIDIDLPSVNEAASNFSKSPWKDRLCARPLSFDEIMNESIKFDLVISNPPYFDSGVTPGTNSRLIARHIDSLSPFHLIKKANNILTPAGRLSMIVPAEQKELLLELAKLHGLAIRRMLLVRGSKRKIPKRVLLEFDLNKEIGAAEPYETLTIHEEDQSYSEEYKKLTGDYYLNF